MNPCMHEKEIGEMSKIVSTLAKQVYGNGQKGMAFTIPELQTDVRHLSCEIAELKTAVSGILKYVSETQGFMSGAQAQKQKSLTGWQRTSLIVGSIVGIITFLKAFGVI